MRISDWSSDVCSSYLFADQLCRLAGNPVERHLTAIDGLLRQLPGLEETRGPKPDVQAHGKGLRFHVLIMPPDAIARCVEREADRKRGVEGQSGSIRVEFGGGRNIKKKNKRIQQ